VSLAYIELGENNGGIIVNLSESGLAVTSAAPLEADGPVRLQFQLPGSSSRLSARGEIRWIGDSKKEVGLHFVEPFEEVRSRIADWISSQESLVQWNSKTASAGKARSADPPDTRSGKSAMTGSAVTNETTLENIQRATETEKHAPRGEESVRSRPPQQEQGVPDNAGAEQSLEPSDRRRHVRRPVPSLAYIDLGENNGGIILNLSEGGLVVTSAAPLYADGRARLQFQLPGSSDRLKVDGEIAWISPSKKEAGLQFVDLSEDVRHRITSWISSQAPSVRFEAERPEPREKAWRRLEMPTIGKPLEPAHHNPIALAARQKPMPDSNVAPTLFGQTTTHHRLDIAAPKRGKKVLLDRRTWATLALVVVLGALTSFLAGWFTAVPDSWKRRLARFGKTTSEASETAGDVKSPPPGTGASVEIVNPPTGGPPAVSASNDGNLSGTEETRDGLAAPSNASIMGASALRMGNSQEHAEKPHPASTSANILRPLPSPRSGTAEPQGLSINTASNPTASLPTVPSNVGSESSLPVKAAEKPEPPKPSFSVNFNPYPSIRMPPGLKLQTSPQGARLEIGRLLSRVDPVYPEDGQTQGVEGTVKLHIVIGTDGSVQSLEPISGPALLIPAAVNAVRQWRYTESSIGGQPVEAEEDITITFRLPAQSAHPN